MVYSWVNATEAPHETCRHLTASEATHAHSNCTGTDFAMHQFALRVTFTKKLLSHLSGRGNLTGMAISEYRHPKVPEAQHLPVLQPV